MGKVNTAEDITKKVGKVISEGIDGNILNSNKPINAISSLFGLAEFGSRVATNPNNLEGFGQIISEAAKDTWTKDGSLQMGKIAGSYIGAASAYRVLSGGGIYRDANGNADLIGIPFV